MAIEMTMVKGLTEDTVKRLASLKTEIEQRFVRIDARLDAMNVHLNQMGIGLDRVDTRMDRMENMLAHILVRLPEKL